MAELVVEVFILMEVLCGSTGGSFVLIVVFEKPSADGGGNSRLLKVREVGLRRC